MKICMNAHRVDLTKSAKKRKMRNKNQRQFQPRSNDSGPTSSKRTILQDFRSALSDYRALRNIPHQPNLSTTTIGTASPSSPSPIIIVDDSDTELEEGEIVDEESSVAENCVEKLMQESLAAVQRSRTVRANEAAATESGVGGSKVLFYEDKNLEEMKFSTAPLYHTRLQANQIKENDESQELICLDMSQSNTDDSVIYVSPVKSSAPMPKPYSLSPSAISSLYRKIPNIPTLPVNENLQRKQKRILRVRNYEKKKKILRSIAKEMQHEQGENSNAVHQMQSASTSAAPDLIAPPPPIIGISAAATPPSKESEQQIQPGDKRIILIDGSNVALGYSEASMGKLTKKEGKDFSAQGLKKAIDHFASMGFSQVKAVVPEFRIRREKSSDATMMTALKDAGSLLLTPSKSYDDLMLLQAAKKFDAAILSNDHFRDIREKHKEYVEVIEKRQIRYNWAFGELLLVDDPYGRGGPKLRDILYK